MELHRGHTVFNTKSEGGEFLIKLGFTRVLFISNVKHEGTLNRRTSLAEIWGGGGERKGSFSMKDEGPRLSARLLNRHCEIPPLPLSAPPPNSPLIHPRVKNTLTASGHSATLCDVRWSFLEGLAKETIRVRRTVKKRKRKRGEGGKKGGIPNRGIFAALWPWTKTISRDNLVKDHSFPQGTLQRGIFFFSFCNAPR